MDYPIAIVIREKGKCKVAVLQEDNTYEVQPVTVPQAFEAKEWVDTYNKEHGKG